jgi:hypothetical protein
MMEGDFKWSINMPTSPSLTRERRLPFSSEYNSFFSKLLPPSKLRLFSEVPWDGHHGTPTSLFLARGAYLQMSGQIRSQRLRVYTLGA